MRTKPDIKLWAHITIWFALVSSGLFAMADYGSQTGRQGDPPATWPRTLDNLFTVDTQRPTLVVFAHPLCPCTRATLLELESMNRQLQGMLDIHVLFFEPEDPTAMPDVWTAADLKRLAARLPDVNLHKDVDGQLARHFGAYTSGQVLLYGTDDRLLFAGGITISRGHVGPNPGRGAVISAVVSDKGVDPLAPRSNVVFGCSLHTDEKTDRKIQPDPEA